MLGGVRAFEHILIYSSCPSTTRTTEWAIYNQCHVHLSTCLSFPASLYYYFITANARDLPPPSHNARPMSSLCTIQSLPQAHYPGIWYFTQYRRSRISPFSISKLPSRASQAKDPAKICMRHRRQSPLNMQPCGDKKQIFQQNLHPHFFSLHHEVVFTKP